MDRLSRPELILHLRALGEEAPEGWTKIEVQQRIAEIAEANPSLAATTTAKTDMQTWMSKLNKASRKKSELRTFCETDLGLMVGDCDTIAVMQKKATSKILEISEPQGCEPMGFGKHSQRTYSETYHYDRDYCEWVKTTHKEGDCCPRLARFARWLSTLEDTKVTPPLIHVPRPKARGTKVQAKTVTASPENPTTSSSSSSQNAEPDARDQLLLQMAATIKDLQEEMSQIRAERPRKVAVVKGCSVGLKGRNDRLVQKGFQCGNCLLGRDATPHFESAENGVPYDEGWHQYFGHPRALRVDPAGSFRSFALIDQYCDKHGVFLDVIPGEAHWKNGVCEQAIQGVKELMSRLCSYDPELTSEGALAEAVTVFNHRDMVRGFSPAQHVLGRGADDTDRFVEAGQGLPPGLLIENPEGEFARAARRRAEAEKIHADWNARQRINRAANSRHRPCYNYLPGELVFFWRSQESGKGRRQPGTRQGRFLGPARILATETRKSESGELSPGGAVWLVRGRNLIKCAPEQLRRATEREEILEGMSAQAGQPTPWTFTQVAENLGGNQFQDATTDVPALQEWRRAQEATEASQPSRLRIRQKRPAPPMSGLDAGGDSEMRPEAEPEATPLQRPRLEPQGQESGLRGECWWSTVSEQAWPDVPAAYWSDQQAAVEVEVAIPETQRGILRMTRNFEGYFVGQMKRKAVEVSERRLSPEEQAEFRGAKQVEVKNFLSADAFEALPKHLQPSCDQAVGMRWVLTWKLKDDGTRKAKARAVLLGYQDPCYEHRSTTAPVMTRQSRQMLLQMAAWKRWRVRKGDVSGAFLQGREYPDTLYCIPTPEICEAMNLPENSVTKIKRACYGLVDAPLEWYRTVDAFLQSIGMERCSSDACMWCYREQGELKGLISGHVDDFIFGGDDSHQGWCDRLKQIQEKFRWGDWETDKFTQCGVLIEATPQGFSLSQPSYLEGISEIGVNATRRKDKQAGTSERERTQLRALLGGLSWHAQQVAPHLSADVSLLLSEVSHSTVDTIIRANILLQHAKARAQHKMIIHGFTPGAELGLVAWVDAAAQSRVDGGSTQGIVIGMVPRNLLHGEMCEVSLMSWHSSKIDRTCRSPGASEALAAINGEDNLYYARFQWSELLYGNLDLRRPDLTVRKTFGCLVTDSRNVYDKMNNEVIVVKGAEKRTSIELLGLKEAQRRTDVIIRWVHSEAQLANSLTKTNGLKELEMFYRMGHRWRIVEDEQMQSARRRRELGLLPLSQTEGVSKDSNHSNDSEVLELRRCSLEDQKARSVQARV
ncbi:Copia protein [Symbiodinium microadriaticum]|uniref:Copia protein n=1 Tax=Symbiodinium microadriaticum TaxID=2951 RepID=A0A1Q9E0A8_SYMMI|nr:Copia protein [Symbiodinium microadriaticum]